MMQSRRIATPVLVALCFFASGAAALAFETLWFRQAGLAFGNGIWASSMVLSGFMAGMALGNWLATRVGDRVRNPIRVYGVLELLVAVAGVALVYALPVLGHVIAPLRGLLAQQPAVLNASRLVLAFALLLLPSTAMGMTLPLLTRALSEWDPNFGRVLGLLYGANTLGAVLGVATTEAVWVDLLGIRRTAWVAALAALAAAAGALWLGRGVMRASTRQHSRPPDTSSGAARWLVSAFAAGFALLALEVVWLRFLLLFLNDTALAFAMVLAVVLAGIALGGLAGSVWSSLSEHSHRWTGLVAYLAGAVGLAGYLLYPTTLESFLEFDQDAQTFILVSAPLVFPTSFASGVLFTLMGVGLRRTASSDAITAGRLTLANTLGAALGSVVAGFVLLPWLGMELSMFLLFCLYGLVGMALVSTIAMAPALRYGSTVVFAALLASFPFGDVRAKYVEASARRWMTPDDRIVAVREALIATIIHIKHGLHDLDIFDQLATNAYSMSVNDFAARRYMKLYVYLPTAVHPHIRRALVIGYGLGNTAKALTDSQELERIDVVDISDDMLEMSRGIYTDAGELPYRDPRVRVHIEDGRHFLQSTDQRFDLITGEPPPPTLAGVVSLYTTEYFQLMRDRLTEGGFVTYWLPMMNITADTGKSIIRAFCDAFADCSLWHGSARNFMLVGTRGTSGPVDQERFTEQWRTQTVHEELQSVGLEHPGQLGALFIGDSSYLAELTRSAKPVTDDRPMRMHQPGTRTERNEMLWEWRDTNAAKKRFGNSELIDSLWPPEMKREALRNFENQRLINDLLFPGPTNAKQVHVLHQVLERTPLSFPVLLMLDSSPDVQDALRRASKQQRQRPELMMHRVAGALAERDYEEAWRLLQKTPDDQVSLQGLRNYVEQGARAARSEEAASDAEP